ncbi:MAG TPA: glycine betaine ABC transporter substrate-binding protein [Burkholderiales bacterium]|nr:glycine betaine ABC transporter substrate-binding protein [Burkholderiales bacterium]
MMKILALLCLLPALCAAQTINVGSKRFTESYILGEILTQTVQHSGEAAATHQQGLGNTAIVFSALKSGAVDLYPDYTGTIAFELLGLKRAPDLAELRRMLNAYGLGVGNTLGFNNTYALAIPEKRGTALGIVRISDLARTPDLKLGLSQEFLSRKDGWQALKAAYALPHAPRGLDHGLAYEALAAGQVDLIDVYSTDAKLGRYGLRLLEDDRGFFPAYEAVVLYRLDLPQRYPRSWAAVQALEGRIDAARMAAMNAAVELESKRFSEVAREFLSAAPASADNAHASTRPSFLSVLFGPDLGRLTLQHLFLVLGSLAPAVAVGLPLGIWAARSRRAAHAIMAIVGVLQTIPALALLAFLITVMGTIGSAPAIVALFLYGLLPIVRNTATGLIELPLSLRESASALGLPESARLRRIELPLASGSILAGIKTSAVIAVGTATIAAFIGAGGYGERIVSGLAVNDHVILLAGAVPAAVLALLMQGIFEVLERWLVPRGLRLGSESPQAG